MGSCARVGPGKEVAEKIEPQFPRSPAGRLFFAVVERAVLDLTAKPPPTAAAAIEHKKRVVTAARYLSGEVPHAEWCGVDSDWIRLVLKRDGVDIYAWL